MAKSLSLIHIYTVYPTQGPGGMVDGEKATLRIPALSWNVIRFVPVEK